MFKLESYITPLLMGYIDKYVKLNAEDFQLSLWGGDAVLGKLDLRLDVIENAIQLPIVFKSGFIHELRIHVPWTRLYSEPVVITINTIECIVKLRDSVPNSEASSMQSRSESSASLTQRPVKVSTAADAEDLPPGYLQSLLNKILHNMNIVVNNLILKFYEDDIVLSLNIKSAEFYSVGSDWKRSFVELALPELVLRRILDFHDLTLCLDKRNASGQIEMYQDPILYRCSLTCRFYMRYENLSAKLPFITKMNVLCERLDMSLTETQLPMFCRLMELCMAIYFGTLDLPVAINVPTVSAENTVPDGHTDAISQLSESAVDEVDLQQQQGWISWAWQFVPQMTSSSESPSSDADVRPVAKKLDITIFDFGIYIMDATVLFKISQPSADRSCYGGSRNSIIPLMRLDLDGIGLEATMKGEHYFDLHFGITTVGMNICNLDEMVLAKETKMTNASLTIGTGNTRSSDASSSNSFTVGSLFDDQSAENRGTPTIYTFDEMKHSETYTETYALQRYGAFWMDYMFTAKDNTSAAAKDAADASVSVDSHVDLMLLNLDLKEKTVMSFIVGPANVTVSSHAVDCVMKFFECMNKHEYEPYSKPRQDDFSQPRRPLSDSEVAKLEEHIATRTMHVTFVDTSFCIQAASAGKGDMMKRLATLNRTSKKSKINELAASASRSSSTPAWIVRAARVELQLCSPTYAKSMAKYCSLLAVPSEHIVYHCHSHMNLKFVDLSLNLAAVGANVSDSCCTIPPFTFCLSKKQLLYPKYWKNALQPRVEQSVILPQLVVEMSKAELMFTAYVVTSWLQVTPVTSRFAALSLMNDVLVKHSESNTILVHRSRYGNRVEIVKVTDLYVGCLAEVWRMKSIKSKSYMCCKQCSLRSIQTPGQFEIVDVRPAGARSKPNQPTIRLTMTDLTVTHCDSEAAHSFTGILSGLSVSVVSYDDVGGDCVRPLLCAPVSGSNIYTAKIFTDPPDAVLFEPTPAYFAAFTIQIPKTANVQAPCVVYIDVSGIFGSFDHALFDWLKYMPTAKSSSSLVGTPSSGQGGAKNGAVIVAIDADIAEATVPIRKSTSKGSCSETTGTVPTVSNPISSSRQPPHAPAEAVVTEMSESVNDHVQSQTSGGWGNLFAKWYPLIKIMELQVNIKSWCLMLPKKYSLFTGGSVSTSLRTVHDLFISNKLSEVIVICGPEVSVASTGHKNVDDVIREIPIKTLEHSIASDKLPWTVKVDHFAIYSVHQSARIHHLLKPCSMCATLAVTTKYQSPMADHLSLLGLCIHADMQTIEMAVVSDQISLIYEIISKWTSVISQLWTTTETLIDLYVPHLSSSPPRDDQPATTDAVATRPPATPFGPMTASSSFPESPNFMLATTTLTSESISVEATGSEPAADSDHVELSLWLQWTLMKFIFTVHGARRTDKAPICVTAVFEDITTSGDFHCVYFKVKSKLGIANVYHYVCRDSVWKRGSHEGIILSSVDNTTQNATMFCQRSWRHHISMHRNSVGPASPNGDRFASSDSGSHGFLNVVFTGARRGSARHRLHVFSMTDVKTVKPMESSLSYADEGYLYEICCQVQPCNVVVNGSAIACLVDVLPSANNAHSPLTNADSFQSGGHARHSSSGSGISALPIVSSSSLPLLYVDVYDFKLFVPNGQLDAEDDRPPLQFNDVSADVCIMQFGSLSVVPQAVNPLPRLVIDKDVYSRAIHAGITSLAGSDVEDRQYQLDLRGLSLSTGCWAQLASRRDSGKLDETTASKNPALAWNMLANVREDEEIRLLPVVSCFDLRATFAPAIVYSSKVDLPILVCGHSTEINATSDIDFYISIDQLRLFVSIWKTNIGCLVDAGSASSSSSSSKRPAQSSSSSAEHDSGIGSESASVSLICQPHLAAGITTSTEMNSLNWLAASRFDVFLTAKRISLMLYEHVLSEHGMSSKPTTTTREFGNDGDEPNEMFCQESVRDALHNVPAVLPLVHVSFSQPHSFVVCNETNQKMELSCYDVALRGPQTPNPVTSSSYDELKFVPELADFPVHWLETKPGKANPKTGIPACLYTLKIMDYLGPSAGLVLDIGRPIQLCVSPVKLEHLQLITDKIRSALNFEPEMASHQSARQASVINDNSAYLKGLGWRHHCSLSTVQIVLALDAVDGVRSASAKLAVAGITAELGLALDLPVPEVMCDVTFHSLQFKTAWKGSTAVLVGPTRPEICVRALWDRHSGRCDWPRVIVAVSCGSLPLHVGQEHVLALELLTESFQELWTKTGQTVPASTPQRKTSGKLAGPRKSITLIAEDETDDDLRTGHFEYVTECSTDKLPGVGEIMFHTDTETGCASMTWRYPECRVIKGLFISPVPFTVAARYNVIDQHMRVPCLLQYSRNPQHQLFENYAEFHLSENSSAEVKLPELDGADKVKVQAADVWRVLILNQLVTKDNDGQNIVHDDGTHSISDDDIVPLVSPMALAACVRVKSSFARSLVPACQLLCTATCIKIGVHNQADLLRKAVPSVQPFKLVDVKSRYDVLTLNLANSCLQSELFGCESVNVHANMSSVASCSVLEYGSLTIRPVIDSLPVSLRTMWHTGHKPRLEVEAELGRTNVFVGQALLHTLNGVIHSWQHMYKPKSERLTMEYYVVCNNTQYTLHFGQAETEESIFIQSREAYAYTWRSQKLKQCIQIGLEGMPLSQCSPVDINVRGVVTVTIKDASEQTNFLVVRVKQLTSSQKQVVISGQLTVASMLSRRLQLKMMTINPFSEQQADLTEYDSTSFIVDQSNVKAIKISLNATNPVWSSDISSSVSNKTGVGHLVKVPMPDKSDAVHVWCHVYTQQHACGTEFLMVFLPLFIVRAQLPASLLMKVETARLKACTNLDLAGKGHEQQLYLSGGDVTHTITFQLGSNLPPSSPVVSLSSDTIQQVGCEKNLSAGDAIEIVTNLRHKSLEMKSWPYNSLNEPTGSPGVAPQPLLECTVKIPPDPCSISSVDIADQPNIDLQVTLTQQWQGLNTLLIDVSPHWLLVNECNVNLVIVESSGLKWNLPAGKAFAPPSFERDLFSVGIQLSGQLHLSDYVYLCNKDDVESLYPSAGDLSLYWEGHLSLDIPIKVDGVTVQLCCLSVHSTYQQHMRVVTVRERFYFVNRTSYDLDMCCACAVLSRVKVPMVQDACVSARVTPDNDDGRSMCSVLLWNSLRSDPDVVSSADAATYVYYVSFKLHHVPNRSTNDDDNNGGGELEREQPAWSYPMRLRMTQTGMRHSVALPPLSSSSSEPLGCMAKSCCMIVQVDQAVVYVTLTEDTHPSVILYNYCDVVLHYGQAVTETSHFTDATVQEEVELISDLPRLEPHSSICYVPPLANSKFPDLNSTVQLPKLHLAGAVRDGLALWSQGIDLALEHGTFAKIPEVYDVKVSSCKVGHTLHVSIEPVSRAEVSAKEIRSRLNTPVKVEAGPAAAAIDRTPPTLLKPHASGVDVSHQRKAYAGAKLSPNPKQQVQAAASSDSVQFSISCLGQQIGIVLLDEASTSGAVREVLCATVENLSVSCCSELSVLPAPFGLFQHIQHIRVGVGDVQLDNMLYRQGSYDFPVLLARQSPYQPPPPDSGMFLLTVSRRIENLLPENFITCSVDLVRLNGLPTNAVQSVKLAVKPLTILIEDIYISDLLKVVDSILPSPQKSTRRPTVTSRRCPAKIYDRATILSNPVRIEQFVIDKIDAKISVHASLKLYIASDNAPLSLGKYEQTGICTTSDELVKVLGMHYASCAIYRAGLLVGSLEILGNPTGLLRNVGNGIADMFRLPYQGLAEGPGAFLSGVRRGSSSFLWHLTTGTLTSITDFASSVSRNMERLSLDSDHVKRNEALRRNKPCRVSEGLKNGLSGLGLSLLGAVAGIADQPLQVWTRSDEPGSPTSSGRVATGFVSGIGKGLVGVVTKPIGGAAEFVSQTSMGILHQVGLIDTRQSRRCSVEIQHEDFCCSAAKYQEKLLQLMPNPEVLIAVAGWQLHDTDRRSTGSSEKSPSARTRCALVLTQDVLTVVSTADDMLLRTFTVADINCVQENVDDDSSAVPVLTVLVLSKESTNVSEIEIQKDRVAAFVSGSLHSNISTSSRCSNVEHHVTKYRFLIDDCIDLFLAEFGLAKDVALNSGFVV